jgi:hypothetical protein
MAIEPASGPPTLTLYSRKNCLLCDEMLAELEHFRTRFSFAIEVIDIDGSDALRVRYGKDVPVLAHQRRELCRHRLKAAMLTAYLSSFL